MQFREFILKESIEDLMNYPHKLPKMNRRDIEELMKFYVGNGYYRYSKKPMEEFLVRRDFASKYSWSIPCKEAMDAIKKWARPPLHDVMAGTGFWAKILNESGVKTIAYDLHNSKKYNTYKHAPSHFDIKRQNAIRTAYKLQKTPNASDVLLSWVPYESSVGYHICKTIPVGSRIFSIGEDYGGCTGDAAYHIFLSDNCKLLENIDLPQFPGLHDSLSIYEKIQDNPVDQNKLGVMG